mmetsp:Transcript_77519/g.153907  ORF Transcript_77519/g.153907 Transcript_77519/m.153907 type:complete len:111 (+) Transcript_77519:1401-1733(+)
MIGDGGIMDGGRPSMMPEASTTEDWGNGSIPMECEQVLCDVCDMAGSFGEPMQTPCAAGTEPSTGTADLGATDIDGSGSGAGGIMHRLPPLSYDLFGVSTPPSVRRASYA